MKRALLKTVIFLQLLILSAIFFGRHNSQVRDAEMLEAITHRNEVDSLYHDHMSKCSYILQDQVTVGHGGVLYSSYHIKNR
jgi:hypothetical protein